MKIVSVILLITCLSACGAGVEVRSTAKVEPSPTSSISPLPSVSPTPCPTCGDAAQDDLKELVKQLNQVAAEKNLTWSVYCAFSRKVAFTGFAHRAGRFEIYYEDGANPWYSVDDFPSQTAAARALLALMRGEPNVYPLHKPKDEIEPVCTATPLRGGVR